jgi:hypothetical protein
VTATPGATQPRNRPSAWWFLGPLAVFLVTAAITGVMVVTLIQLGGTDARVRLDGQPQVVEVSTDRDRMIWVDQELPTPDCEVRGQDGRDVALHPVKLKTTRDSAGGRESGRWQFDPGDGRLEVRCTLVSSPSHLASIGPAVSLRVMLTEFLPWFLLAMALSAVWIGWLVVLVIRTAKGSGQHAPPPPPWTHPA